MSSSTGQDGNKENHAKRQNFDSPSAAVMSPSVRAPSKKLSRLSGTPVRRELADVNKVDPNIDASLMEPSSVTKKTECGNIEASLVEPSSITERTECENTEAPVMEPSSVTERTECENTETPLMEPSSVTEKTEYTSTEVSLTEPSFVAQMCECANISASLGDPFSSAVMCECANTGASLVESFSLTEMTERPNTETSLVKPSFVTETCECANIGESFVDPSSVTESESAAVKQTTPDSNTQDTLTEMTSTFEELTKETASERSHLSESGDTNLTAAAATPSSLAAMLSPGMSDEMKMAIKTYLKSHPIQNTSINAEEVNIPMERTESQSVDENVKDSGKTTPSSELSVQCSESIDDTVQPKAMAMEEEIFEKSAESEQSIPDLEESDDTACSEVTTAEESTDESEAAELSVVDSEMVDDSIRSSRTAVEAEEKDIIKAPLQNDRLKVLQSREFASPSTPKCFAKKAGGLPTPRGVRENWTLSAYKKNVLEKRNLQLDDLSSPRELANYGRERAQEYSFLINEVYCDTSAFCDNCYAMRTELGLFSDKFAALAVALESGKIGEERSKVFAAELESTLRNKETQILELTSNVKEMTETINLLVAQKEFAEKDAESYRFLYEQQIQPRAGDVGTFREKTQSAQDEFREVENEFTKQSNEEREKLQAEVDHLKGQLELTKQQLEIRAALHEHDRQRIEDLESEHKKATDERDQLQSKLQQLSADLEDARNDRKALEESASVRGISLLETKIAELGQNIDEALRAKEDEATKQRSFLLEKLTSLLDKFRDVAQDDAFASRWETTDTADSLDYFEAVLRIILQDAPQFEILIDSVAQRKEATKTEIQKLKAAMDQALAEKAQLGTVLSEEGSKFRDLQEAMLRQFSDNKNCFIDLLHGLEEKVYSLARSSAVQSKEDFDHVMSEVLERMRTTQEGLKEKSLEGLNELQRCATNLEAQHETISSFVKTELQKTEDKVETVREVLEKVLVNSNTLLNSMRNDEVKELQEAERKNQLESIKGELQELKMERDVLHARCEQAQEMQEELRKTVVRLQKTEEDLKSQTDVACKNLDNERENVTRAIHVSENLMMEKEKLIRDNTELKDKLQKLEEEVKDLKEAMTKQQGAEIKELENMVRMLKIENERLGRACDDADEEVGELKQQLFEAMRTNARLEAEKHGEGEDAVNRRMGYIETAPIQPRIHPPSPKTNLAAGFSVADAIENPPKSKLGSNVDEVLASKAEVAEEVLGKRMPAGGSPKSKNNRDQSCRTS